LVKCHREPVFSSKLSKKAIIEKHKAFFMETRVTHSLVETKVLAQEVAGLLRPGLVTLSGDLGAGKTSFAQGILEALGAEGPWNSPTFVLMKEYELPQETATGIRRVYHTDAYRVEAKDFQELGFLAWIEEKDTLTILEWPEKIAELLPGTLSSFHFTVTGEEERIIDIQL
jgi:tRNA threonylcarbamoyladenosine biosynthesis protein TsaE